MTRSERTVLAKLSALSIVVFMTLVIANQMALINNKFWGFAVALLSSFIIPAYLVSRCKLDLWRTVTGMTLWRGLDFSTTGAIFCILLAIVHIDSVVEELSIRLSIVSLAWLIPLIATWFVLLNEDDESHPKGKKMAYLHFIALGLLCGYLAIWKTME